LQHNTIIALARTGDSVQSSSSLFGHTGAVLRAENNFIGAANGSAAILYGCQNARFETFRANAVWAAAGFSVLTASDATCNTNPMWVDTPLGRIAPNATAVTLTTLAGLLEPADPSMFAAALRSGAIRPSSSRAGCGLSRGGIDLLANVPRDIEGKMRTATPAIGAWEASAPDCP
jgi:hypothetical protein